MSWADHLRKHIREREDELLHVRCQVLEIKVDPNLSDIERKKALDNAHKDRQRLEALVSGLIDAQSKNDNA